MKFPFLASLIVFIMVMTHLMNRRKKLDKKEEDAFWKREEEANSVRAKSLKDLDYVVIPMEKLPLSALPGRPEAEDCIRILQSLADQKIVNLTGYSNTDLKLEYGTANITPLSEYDQNYTLLVRTLQKWADLLMEEGLSPEAQTVMEFALSTHTDVSRTYLSLAEIYASRGETDKIKHLLEEAQNLRSINKSSIVRTLQESYL